MTPREDGVTDGRRPDGNRAEVEVVSTSDLLPGNVVWCEDGWYAVLDSDQNDSTQVSAAQIIDDAGGQDEDGLLYGEWFLRLAHPAATAREEVWKAMVEALEQVVPDWLPESASEAAPVVKECYVDIAIRLVRARRALALARSAGAES